METIVHTHFRNGSIIVDFTIVVSRDKNSQKPTKDDIHVLLGVSGTSMQFLGQFVIDQSQTTVSITVVNEDTNPMPNCKFCSVLLAVELRNELLFE